MEMIRFEKAYEIVMNSSFPTENEIIYYTNSLNRILAGDVISDIDMPPFNKSSVDGFACLKSELGEEMEIIETVPAGTPPVKTLGKLQCTRIMTGAVVPSGADCIFMVEDSEILSSGKVRFKGSFTKENIAIKGEDVKKGDIVLRPGKQIKPQDIAVMASVGCIEVKVSCRPRVAVISSGDELVEPHEYPGLSQIRNSNAFQLMAQAERSGALGEYYGIARDDEEKTFKIVEKAISECDIVLISGGVSMGDFDFVPSVLERAGTKILFTRVAVQPGKPTTFGVHQKALVFGLPGNPVSSFIQFELLVRPLICKMMGHQWQPATMQLPMKDSFSRLFADRMAWVPVRITGDRCVSTVEYHGSAHIFSLHEADGIISVPVDIKMIEKGQIVDLRLL